MTRQDYYNRRRKGGGGRIFIIVAVLLLILGGAAFYLVDKYMPNFKIVSVYDFYTDFDKNGLNLVMGDERVIMKNKPQLRNDEVYLPVGFVQDRIDKYIFWDSEASKLTITTEDKVIRMKTDDLTYFVNQSKLKLNLPVYNMEDTCYIPESILKELYEISITLGNNSNYNTVILDKTDEETPQVKVKAKKTAMRFEPSIKSPIIENLQSGTTLCAYGEENGFTRVRTESGLIGYAATKDLEETEPIPAVKREDKKQIVNPNAIEGKINLVWDQVTKPDANLNKERRIPHSGVNVLSFTWFSFDEEKMNGDIINIADKSLVDWAHQQGYQVWGLITDNFKSSVSHAVLSNTDVREHVIKQLLAFISMYDLDGINIDYENVSKADAPYYLQFLRELKPLMTEQGAILSVDMYVPTYTKYYNREEVQKTVDYICVMTYDEHYAGSETSGPVASLPFVEDGIVKTLEEVPKEKILMGIPFYNRIWREEVIDGKTTHTIKNLNMNATKKQFLDNGAEFEWDSEIGSYYGEYTKTENGKEITYKVWLEDERSIEEKMKIYKKYDLKGVASWKRGLEKEGIFEIIGENLE